MKRTKFKLLDLLTVSLVICCFTACNDEEDVLCTRKTVQGGVYDNYVTFADFDEMESTIQMLADMTEEDISVWEHRKNFVSMQSIADMVTAAEEVHCDTLETRYNSYESIKEDIHSDLFNSFADLFIRRECPDDTGFYYDLDINNATYASVVNKDGIVKIGSDIYQFKDDVTKIIVGGDVSKIKILSAISRTDSNQNIIVHKNYGLNLTYTENNVHKHTTKKKNGKKVITYYDFIQNYTSDYPEVCTTQKVKVRSLKSRLWGAYYVNHKTSITLTSTFNGNTVSGYTRDVNTNPFIITGRTINWSLNNDVKTYKKKHTIDLCYFIPKNVYFYSVVKPQIYNGVINVRTSAGISSNTNL